MRQSPDETLEWKMRASKITTTEYVDERILAELLSKGRGQTAGNSVVFLKGLFTASGERRQLGPACKSQQVGVESLDSSVPGLTASHHHTPGGEQACVHTSATHQQETPNDESRCSSLLNRLMLQRGHWLLGRWWVFRFWLKETGLIRDRTTTAKLRVEPKQ